MVGAEIALYKPLIEDPAKRNALARSLAHWRETCGENWLEQFVAAHPHLALLIDFCANYEFDEGYRLLKEHIDDRISSEGNWIQQQLLKGSVSVFLNGAVADVRLLHSTIKAEIDKPRF